MKQILVQIHDFKLLIILFLLYHEVLKKHILIDHRIFKLLQKQYHHHREIVLDWMTIH